MLITKKRVLNLDLYTSPIIQDSNFIFRHEVTQDDHNRLQKAGFSSPLENGDTILPKPIGPVTRFNSLGRYLVRRDLPMETHTREAYWTWKQFAGRDQTETVSKTVDVPYKRYPRDLIAPPSIELSIYTDQNTGKLFIVTPSLTKNKESQAYNTIALNLLLELFGEAELCDTEKNPIQKFAIKRLNWEFFPKGKYPWERVLNGIKEKTSGLSENKKLIIQARLKTFEGCSPDFVAVGLAGFSGYFVYGFEKSKNYVLESLMYGNASYVMSEGWEAISKLTKAQVINEILAKERIVHNTSWPEKISKYLK